MVEAISIAQYMKVGLQDIYNLDIEEYTYIAIYADLLEQHNNPDNNNTTSLIPDKIKRKMRK